MTTLPFTTEGKDKVLGALLQDILEFDSMSFCHFLRHSRLGTQICLLMPKLLESVQSECCTCKCIYSLHLAISSWCQ